MGAIVLDINKVNSYVLPSLNKSTIFLRSSYSSIESLKNTLPSTYNQRSVVNEITNQIYNVNKEINNVKKIIENKIESVKRIETKTESRVSSLAQSATKIGASVSSAAVGAVIGATTTQTTRTVVSAATTKTATTSKNNTGAKTLWGKFVSGVKKVVTNTAKAIKDTAAKIAKAVKSIWQKFSKTIKDLGNKVVNATKKVGKAITDTGSKVVKSATSGLKKVGSAIVDGFKWVGAKVVNGVKTAAKWVKDTTKTVTSWVADKFKEASITLTNTGACLVKAAKSAWSSIKGVSGTVWTNLKQLGASIVNGFKSQIKEAIHTASSLNFDYSKITEDGFKVQGYTIIDGKKFISAYKDGKDENGNPYKERFYIYDENGNYEGKIITDMKNSHVGGVTYDKEQNILFVSNADGLVKAYNYNAIKEAMAAVNADGKKYTLKIDNITGDVKIKNSQSLMSDTKVNKTSTMYFYDGYLYIATFAGTGKGEMKKFKTVYNEEKKSIEYQSVWSDPIKIPKQTQGIAVTKHKNKQYLIVSQSYGKSVDSNILLYELDEDGDKEYLGKYYVNISGLEGVKVDEKGNVSFVSEFHDKTYVTTMDDIISDVSLDDEDLLNEFASTLGGYAYEAKQWFKKTF